MVGATDELSLVFQALADPTRRAIISRLRGGPTTVGELAEPFAVSRPAISQHLAVLERAGLIERTADAQWRRANVERRERPADRSRSDPDRRHGIHSRDGHGLSGKTHRYPHTSLRT